VEGDTVNRLEKRRVQIAAIPGTRRARTWPVRAIGGLAAWWRRTRGEATLINARDDMLKDMGLGRAEVERCIGGRRYP
jgi:uncharacterized protein YjiS (DUF1127 family)